MVDRAQVWLASNGAGRTWETSSVCSANLDLVRSICEQWERGEYTSVAWAHPEIDFAIADLPTAGRWQGVTGMIEAWRDFIAAWEDQHVEIDEYRELDDERVLVLGAFKGRGKASGVDLQELWPKGANLFRVHDGKVIALVVYFDRAHALADLALATDDDTPTGWKPTTARDIYGDSWIDHS
jgi:ketosteroid isomerase-like protein